MSRRASLFPASLHVLALSAFAFAQPILAVFRGGPEFFVTRRAGAADLLTLVLLLVLAPAALVAILLLGVRRWPTVHRAAVTVLVSVTFGLFALAPISRLTGLVPPFAIAMAAGAGAVFGGLYVRWRPAAGLLTFASLAPLLFGAGFLLLPPISGIAFPETTAVAAAANAGRAPVVIVVFDELSSAAVSKVTGEVDAARFPNLAALARRADWFPNTLASSDSTFEAVPAIVTGRHARRRLLPTHSAHPNTVFSLLSKTHKVRAYESVTNLCAPEICQGKRDSYLRRMKAMMRAAGLIYPRALLPQAYRHEAATGTDVFGELLDVPPVPRGRLVDAVRAEINAGRPASYRRFIQGIVPGPGLHFLHALIPHEPLQYLPSGRDYGPAGYPGLVEKVWVDEWFATFIEQRWLLQAQLGDRLVGNLMRQLDRQGMFDESLIVVLADHGGSFEVGQHWRFLSESNSADVGIVPLLIKRPGSRRGVTHIDPALTVDVLPTIAAALGAKPGWDVDGKDLFAAPRRDKTFRVRTFHKEIVTIRSPDALRREASARMRARFPPQPGLADLFAFGPHAGLVGRPIVELQIAPVGTFSASAPKLPRFARVDLASGFLPAFLDGRLQGAQRAEVTHVGIAINGIVATVVPVYEMSGFTQFGAMLPEGLFRQGANTVELLGVGPRGLVRARVN